MYAIHYYNSNGKKLQGKAALLSPTNEKSSADFLDFRGSLHPPILLSCGDAAADMPLGLILIQNHLYLPVESGIDTRQSILEIFMYCTFRDSEFFCGAPNS